MTKYSSDTLSKETVDVVRRMAILAEIQDRTIVGHIDRMRGYSRVLARGLTLSPYEVDMISTASMLHDIGKSAVPFDTLQKAGSLTDAEWEIVRGHPRVGADLLHGSPVAVLQIAEIIALTHHERWDGSGYPQGLAGEAIPLSGRVCALADVFDALTTDRPYKPEVRVEAALEMIQEASGSLFDPNLVGVFSQQFDELCRVRSQFL
jgi:putative two-component system response regulator